MTAEELINEVGFALAITAIAMLTFVSCKQAFEIREQAREIYGHGLEVYNHSPKEIIRRAKEIDTPGSNVEMPPEGKITITPKDPTKKLIDVVNLRYQTFGFTFEPGLNLSADRGHFNFGFDTKFLYWDDFGLNAGVVGLRSLDTLSLAVGVDYNLHKWLYTKNLELDLKFAPRYLIPVWLGLRLSI